MNWRWFKWYGVSSAGYHVAKAGRIPMILRYTAYCPNKNMIEGSPTLSAREAVDLCEEHYAKTQAIPERDY